jgi:hypothetical protein
MAQGTRIVVSTLVAFALLATPAWAQSTAPDLGGEFFESTSASVDARSCPDAASPASITILGSGVAGPPYAGTFTETFTATFGPSPLPGGLDRQLTGFDATFTINSPAGTVQGTKRFVPGVTTATGGCFDTGDGLGPLFFDGGGAFLEYDATITVGNCTFTDRGEVSFDFLTSANPAIGTSFRELFETDGQPPAASGNCKGEDDDGDDNGDDD